MLPIADLYWGLIDILFPPRCSGCGQWGVRFCDLCMNNVICIEEPICIICGEPVKSQVQEMCLRCSSTSRNFDGIRSWAHYQGSLQKAIQKLKYQKDIGLANILVKPLITLFMEMNWKIDLITAVPLDQVKLTRRGYNQAALISKPIARFTGIPYHQKALTKRYPNKPQVGLSEEERLFNVMDVFVSSPEKVTGKTVLVVDDVVTTGATMDACSVALKASGAQAVYGISLARSLRL